MGVADTITSINDSMKGKDMRDNKKQLFKFSGEAVKSDSEAPLSQEALYEQVRARVSSSAGSDASKKLFSLTTQDSPFHIPDEGIPAIRRRQDISNSALTINLASIAVDKYSLSSNLSTEHRLLTSPDIYNIAVLFPHTVLFLDKVQSLLQDKESSSAGTSAFLQDFFSSTFLPQMELKAQQHLKLATTGSHAFQTSTKHKSSHGRPLLNCVGELISLVGNLCSTLQSLPFQREEYIRIIESVLEVFLEKCEACFKGIIVNGQMDEERGGAIVSSIWAQSPEIVSLFSTHPYIKRRAASLLNPKAMTSNIDSNHQYDSYFSNESNHVSLSQLNEKEMEIELQLKQKRSLHTSELLFDNKKLSLLATLSHSMKWFVAQVNQMIGTSQTVNSSQSNVFDPIIASELAQTHKNSSMWSLAQITNHFDSLLDRFEKLADLCLITLRIEFRCHTVYYLDLAVREGNYYIPHHSSISPDTYVTTLNSDLAICEESLHNNLTTDDLRFVFDMLASFMSRVLISTDNVRNIGKMSQRGLEKMFLNIAALQQSLTSLEFFGDKGLAQAHSFYSLYDLDLEKFAERAQDQGLLFSHSEYKSLLDLTLETLHFENTLTLSENNSPLKKPPSGKKDQAQERQVNDLIIQSYHNQLMALREFTAGYDE
ncbi:exocyst subunit [Entomophthora muscae]|uniref:Exocyst subunit n=1 Tax=Entomophthora muscae TaxID=34485 RepID=A0ACC2UQI9_9FUNG|nr:exocyst subunit [Entomophthora muscae]